MKKVLALFLLICGFVPACAFAYERVNPGGPMPIKNQMPMYLYWYAFPQEKAEVADEKKFDAVLDYTVSNVIIDKVTTPTEEYILQADMEVSRYNFNLKYGVMDRLEASAEVPYLVASKGYLDSFVSTFERAVGATPVGARRHADKYQFKYDFKHNGVSLINLKEPPKGIGDISLAAKYLLMDEAQGLPRISARAAVKFPTGSKSKYLGSGKYDYGMGLLLDKSFGRLFAYFNFNAVFINRPDFLKELDIKRYMLSGMLGLEYCFTERLSGIVQGTLSSTPYPKTGMFPLDNKAGEAALGLNYRLTANSNWHIAVAENIFADSTPDVTLQLGGNIKF